MPSGSNLARDRATLHYAHQAAAWGATWPQRHALYLVTLRFAWRDEERPLMGWPAILEYTQHRLQWRLKGQRDMTVHALDAWRARLGCPIMRGRSKSCPPWTTNLMLSAWYMARYCTTATAQRGGGPILATQFDEAVRGRIRAERRAWWRSLARELPRDARGRLMPRPRKT